MPCSPFLDACPVEEAEAGLCLGPPGSCGRARARLALMVLMLRSCLFAVRKGLGQFKGFALLLFLLGFLRCGTLDKT